MKNPLNPDAGYVQHPADPEVLRAVLRAAETSFRATPYYRLRWGERGRRFAWSDSGWLSTLLDHSDEMAVNQTLWLGRVLANRGMPTWLLERHLGVLQRRLALLDTETDRRRLAACQQALTAQRRQVCSDARLDALTARFADIAGQRPHPLVTHVGLLLTTAVIDEQNGMRRATASMLEWMSEPLHWPDDWRRGCLAFVAHARANLG